MKNVEERERQLGEWRKRLALCGELNERTKRQMSLHSNPPQLLLYPISHEQREPVSPSFTFLPNFIRESPCVKRRVRHKTWNHGPLITVWLSGVMSRFKIENDNREIFTNAPHPLDSSIPRSPKTRENPSTMWRISLRASSGLNLGGKKRIEVPTPKENKRQEGGANLICWTCNHATSRRGIEEMCKHNNGANV